MTELSVEDLRPDLRRLIEKGKIDLKTAGFAREIPEEFLAEFEAVLADLSFSNTRIFLRRLREVLAEKTPEEQSGIKERLLAASDPAAELKAVRMPELTDMEKRFTEIYSRLLRGTGVHLKAPPYFEGGRFSVDFSFDSPTELRRKIRALEKLAAEGDELYELL
ncbi:MAG: hypothetical protein LBT68_01490 [Spirochaetales bacterium]|jgi:hypothetical protein|nr:hypothetical protein [Spirochaetales bacterium]